MPQCQSQEEADPDRRCCGLPGLCVGEQHSPSNCPKMNIISNEPPENRASCLVSHLPGASSAGRDDSAAVIVMLLRSKGRMFDRTSSSCSAQ